MAKRATKTKAKQTALATRQPQPARVVRARFDAAQITDENYRHWSAMDGLSPDAAVAAAVRQVLRNKCRYEFSNNSYAKGIGDTLATDCVGGTGPRLQMLTDTDVDDLVEQDFADWAEEVGLAELLRTMRVARYHSGESFGLLATNPNLVSDVKLGVTLVEADQVTDPFFTTLEESVIDGIEYDGYGNPVFYNVLRSHPGGLAVSGLFGVDDFDRWPAKYVLHYYRPDRPGQHRGVPDLTPAVQLFAELRRYGKAVIRKAETAAELAAFLETAADPDGEAEALTTFDPFELEYGTGITLPKGWKISQLRAEEPTTVYGDFVDKKLEEISRCLGVPWTIAALNSSKANMSASYLDGQRYAASVEVDRKRLEMLLNRLLDAWLTEWVRVRRPAAIPDRMRHQWFWPSMGHHADPGKVASARTEALKNGTTSIPFELAKEGRDWEKEQEAAAKSLGVSIDEYRKLLLQGIYGPPPTPPAKPAPDTETDTETETEEVTDDDAGNDPRR